MAKPQYEGYATGKHTVSLRENFGNAQVYGRNAKSILSKATGFINAYDFTALENPDKTRQGTDRTVKSANGQGFHLPVEARLSLPEDLPVPAKDWLINKHNHHSARGGAKIEEVMASNTN